MKEILEKIKYEFTFHYFPDEGDDGAIRIKNRNETVWVKKKNPEDEDSWFNYTTGKYR